MTKAAPFTEATLKRALRAAEAVKPGGFLVRISPRGDLEVLPVAHNDTLHDDEDDDLDAELAAWERRR